LVTGVPKVFYGGQGGLGDVVPHPNFKQNKFIYISYISSDTAGDTRYATVVRAELNIENSPKLEILHCLEPNPGETWQRSLLT